MPIGCREFWTPIKGFERYQVNPYGDVMRISTGRIMKPMDNKGVLFIPLWTGKKTVFKTVARLVADAYIKQQPGKTKVWHKNGLKHDNFAGNLEWITDDELHRRMAKRNPRRKPVVKIDRSGEIVDVYASMEDAARKNHISACAVRNRCFKLVTDPYGLDGHNYAFEV